MERLSWRKITYSFSLERHANWAVELGREDRNSSRTEDLLAFVRARARLYADLINAPKAYGRTQSLEEFTARLRNSPAASFFPPAFRREREKGAGGERALCGLSALLSPATRKADPIREA